jgi:hypothetical protein
MLIVDDHITMVSKKSHSTTKVAKTSGRLRAPRPFLLPGEGSHELRTSSPPRGPDLSAATARIYAVDWWMFVPLEGG